MVQLSTDYVFDGKAPPYTPDAAPNPLNEYGLSKWHAEQRVTEILGSNALVLRVPSTINYIHAHQQLIVVLQFCTGRWRTLTSRLSSPSSSRCSIQRRSYACVMLIALSMIRCSLLHTQTMRRDTRRMLTTWPLCSSRYVNTAPPIRPSTAHFTGAATSS